MRTKLLAAAFAVALLVGCASQSRTTYNTLASVEATTTGAFCSYLQLAITGAIPTNSVPEVSRNYDLFKASWLAAVQIAQWNTNAPSTPVVDDAAARVVSGINQVK